MSLDGRTCLVTGASKGIGRGIAEELGSEGANVVVNYRSSESAAYDVRDIIDEGPGEAIVAQADVSNFDEVEAMYETATEAFGSVDVLVNNAGITVDKKFENMTRSQSSRVMFSNFLSTVMPALLIKTSICPNASCAVPCISSTSSKFETSACATMASPGPPSMMSRTS